MNKPRIITFSHCGALYGANHSLLTLILSLKDDINWIVIGRQEGDFSKELRKNNIPYYQVPFASDVIPVATPLISKILRAIFRNTVNLALLPYLMYLARKYAPAAIHSNSSVFMMGGVIAYLSRIPHIWHIREFTDLDYKVEYDFGKKWFRFWANKADYLICVSKSLRQKRLVNQNITAQSRVIYNGIDSHQSTAQLIPEPHGLFTIALVGVISSGKEQMEAVKAIEILSKSGINIKLRLVGGYERNEAYYQEIKQYIEVNKLEKSVCFEGYIKNTNAIYRDCHLTLMCSRNEGMGRVTIESMSRGIPVIAFDSAGSSEMIQHNNDGILYKGDARELAREVKNLLTDQNRYSFIATNAKISASTKFNVAQYKNNFLEVVSTVL